MAEPVKSDEIEDVLSSIRRLVSEHQPPVQADRESTSADTGLSDKLVLTPALRVTDPDDPWVTIAAQSAVAEDEDERDQRDAPADADAIPDTTGLPYAEGDDLAPDAQADVSSNPPPEIDPQLQSDLWEAGGDAVACDDGMQTSDVEQAVDAAINTAEATDAAAEFIAPLAPVEDDHVEEEEPAAVEAPLSFMRSTSSLVDYEPEEGNVAAPGETPPRATLELAEARAAQQVVADVLSGAVLQTKGDDSQDRPAPVEDATAVVDDAIAPPPAEASVADFLAEAEDDTTEADANPAPDRIAEVEDLGESPFSFPDDDDAFVDEDALREIIVEVVREELQGEMGKRITRNVRKLVRREIRIALATDELDD